MLVSPTYVYKIFTLSEWSALESKVTITGNERDISDGYIHLSTASQLKRIVKKYYQTDQNCVLLKIQYSAIVSKLKWEPNSQGEIFPHYYGEINKSAVLSNQAFKPMNFELLEFN